jgi:DNA ligase (NAD+)
MSLDHFKSIVVEYNNKYRKGNPIISDEEYDMLLTTMENSLGHDEFIQFKQSLTEEKGDVTSGYIIGSLNKLKYEEPEELYKWICKQNIKKIFISEKIDGCSFIASYISGNFVSCSSRGDGQEGTDWTEKAKYILPQTIPFITDLDIRGEFTLVNGTFENLGFKNKRNGTVGIMNSKDIHDYTNLIVPIVYEIMNMDIFGIKDQFDYIQSCGFRVPSHVELIIDAHFMIRGHDALKIFYEHHKEISDYDIDGVVISSSNYKRENKFYPDGKVAFKINSEGIETEVIDIEWQVSKTRYLKPVLCVTPITINGTTISKVTAYNAKYVFSNNIGKGTIIKVVRSGEVIPKVVDIVKSTGTLEIKICPECSSKVEWNGVELQCINKDCCEVKRVESFIKAIGIEYVSVKRLIDFGITTFNKLLAWTPDSKYKSQMTFWFDLEEKVFHNDPTIIMRSFSFNGFGTTLFDKVYSYSCNSILSNMNSLFVDSPSNDYCLPEGVGFRTIEKASEDWEINWKILHLILKDSRYILPKEKVEVKVEIKGNSLDGKTILFTGTMKMNRKTMEQIAVENGATISSSVSTKLNYLVSGDDQIGVSSKWKKADQLGVKIISEQEFLNMIGG